MKEKFKKINDNFDKLGEKFKEELENAKIKPIHPDFLFAQNGIWSFIASMGRGKTYNCLKMVAKQEVLFCEPFFETVVLCSTSGDFDKTTQTFKKAIKKTNIIPVKDDDLVEYLTQYTQQVFIYNTIMQFIKNGLKDPSPEMMKILKENACIDRKGNIDILKVISFISNKLTELGWKTHPHRMLLIMEDFSSHPLLKRKETELSRFLKKLRHFNISVIIIVQTTKSIPKDIKRNLTDCMLFPGINEEDFKYLVKESSLGSLGSPDDLWNQYSKIKDKHTMITYHVSADKIVIQEPNS